MARSLLAFLAIFMTANLRTQDLEKSKSDAPSTDALGVRELTRHTQDTGTPRSLHLELGPLVEPIWSLHERHSPREPFRGRGDHSFHLSRRNTSGSGTESWMNQSDLVPSVANKHAARTAKARRVDQPVGGVPPTAELAHHRETTGR